MRKHHLYVMSLEEYEPNREFVGRNFNAGEVVQLVLKSPRTGRWLPFEYVQMVMMHELAHCKQMNHSRAFWTVRNGYAADMHKLWAEGYTGEGIWGRGASLATGQWERDVVRADEVLPEHLCGGTFRTRGRKRKTKPTLSYQERKERRILKKFGKNGMALGADEETKVKLEKGKKIQAKPRVAGSARGRELRAAAALARFDQHKEEKTNGKKEEDEETESGSDSDYEDGDTQDLDSKDAVDVDGSRLVDSKGRGMARVCADEDVDDPEARNELDELRNVFRKRRIKRESPGPVGPRGERANDSRDSQVRANKREEQEGEPVPPPSMPVKSEPTEDSSRLDAAPKAPPHKGRRHVRIKQDTEPSRQSAQTPARESIQARRDPTTCSVCSFANPEPLAVTCGMCANVLDPANTRGTWRCHGASCVDSLYVNSGDCGVCGLCGQRRGEAP
ncbi:DNA-dependent metalloprotease WSS1 [Tolypocladium ophioglossoides CBS 100239]|uniref:DNA-dependent metalloprotease WSS1 n=1 Tax=Tolypocladium ophioglossoides (strain CBS 100239) TaxID=1163406 RepID=A0A0L0N875_TOLOC|nr:DNA-dependent metalloprotease WSS1 [Tolypocladium ophioglossoides CBS 100239]